MNEYFQPLTLSFEKILNVSVSDLLKDVAILEKENTSKNEHDPSIYLYESSELFNSAFTYLLNKNKLYLHPYSVFIITPPYHKGLFHIDQFYPMPEAFKTSLHMDFTGVGELDFYNIKNVKSLSKTINSITYFSLDDSNLDNEVVVASMPSRFGISLVKTDTPHRSNNNSDKARIVLTSRFSSNPDFFEVKQKFVKFWE